MDLHAWSITHLTRPVAVAPFDLLLQAQAKDCLEQFTRPCIRGGTGLLVPLQTVALSKGQRLAALPGVLVVLAVPEY